MPENVTKLKTISHQNEKNIIIDLVQKLTEESKFKLSEEIEEFQSCYAIGKRVMESAKEVDIWEGISLNQGDIEAIQTHSNEQFKIVVKSYMGSNFATLVKDEPQTTMFKEEISKEVKNLSNAKESQRNTPLNNAANITVIIIALALVLDKLTNLEGVQSFFKEVLVPILTKLVELF